MTTTNIKNHISSVILKPFPKNTSISKVKQLIIDHLGIDKDFLTIRKRHDQSFALIKIKGNAPFTAIEAKLEPLKYNGEVFDFIPQEIPKKRSLNDQVTPLWKLSYDEQLALKHEKISTLVNRVLNMPSQMICPMIPSPCINGYRNKCEFTIGYDSSGAPCVGFLLGGFREGIIDVTSPYDTLHISDTFKQVVRRFQTFLESSPLAPYNRKTKKGFWRLLMVRIHGGKLMIAVQVNKCNEDEQVEKERFQKEFSDIPSLFWQTTDAVYHGLGPSFDLLTDSMFLEESLMNLKFRVSPGSFFQVNIPACESLYLTIKELLGSRGNVLLDLCCGTGTIGICLAQYFDHVIGIECISDAILDARQNALLNNIHNIEFHASKLEDCLLSIINKIPQDEGHSSISVVLDPPRAGAHKSVIKAINQCLRIRRLVYVSCAPEQTTNNWKSLIEEGNWSITKIQPVDMFPHTEHCELALLFERQ